MSSLLIFGAGGHGKVVAETARAMGNWRNIAFADDSYPDLKALDDYPIITDFNGAGSPGKSGQDIVVAIGANRERLELTMQLFQSGFTPVTLVHPAAVVAKSAHIEMGTVIFAQAVVQAASRVGPAVIINTAATVDHDCVIGKGSHLSPGVHLSGEVVVGDYGWLGTGAVVGNQASIGHNVTVGAGACVIRDLPDNVTAVGVPARPVRRQMTSE